MTRMKDRIVFFLSYLKRRFIKLLMLFLFFAIFSLSLALYHITIEAVIYPAVLCIVLFIAYIILSSRTAYKKHMHLTSLTSLPDDVVDRLSVYTAQDDEDYRAIIEQLMAQCDTLRTEMLKKESDGNDYYTMWVHQIKIPIAAMKLRLQNKDDELSRSLSEELQRIESYTDMVLTYQRLDSESTDYVFAEYALENIVKPVIKKFASQFIRRRIRVSFIPPSPDSAVILTDAKWLSFVLEQLISNSLKYTPDGGLIEIDCSSRQRIAVRDNGIGIPEHDIPRIFERGFTGNAGRSGASSSGIGLYLTQRICDSLGYGIKVESKVGEGTAVTLDVSCGERIHE